MRSSRRARQTRLAISLPSIRKQSTNLPVLSTMRGCKKGEARLSASIVDTDDDSNKNKQSKSSDSAGGSRIHCLRTASDTVHPNASCPGRS